jgi:hypothetical protein
MADLHDAMCFLMLCLRPAPALAAENLFLRKQLAQYQERQIKPRRANDATRIALVWLSWLFDWRRARQPGLTPYVPAPGIPLPIRTLPVPQQAHRHRMPTGQYIVARPVIGGLHHDYGLEKQAA